MAVFDLSGLTPEERAITQQAIDAADFDWELLLEGLRAASGREAIPVDWSDLSRFVTDDEAEEDHDHEHEHVHIQQHDQPGFRADEKLGDMFHGHVEEDGDEAELTGAEFNGRRAALGLAWYSGRISIEKTLVTNPNLAIEVFLAEGAHMLDFFLMTEEQREAIFMAFHPNMDEEAAHGHGHGWFEETGNQDYWSWVGESFMAGFILAYAPDIAMPLFPRQPWAHRATPDIGQKIRAILTPEEPDTDTDTQLPYFADSNGVVYHDSHGHPNISRDIWFESLEQAQASGLRACKVCKPGS